MFTLRSLIAIRMQNQKKKRMCVYDFLCYKGLTGPWQQLRRSHLYKIILVINWLHLTVAARLFPSVCRNTVCSINWCSANWFCHFVGSAMTWSWLTWSWSGWQTISRSYFIMPLMSATIVQSSSSWQEQRWGAWVRLLWCLMLGEHLLPGYCFSEGSEAASTMGVQELFLHHRLCMVMLRVHQC